MTRWFGRFLGWTALSLVVTGLMLGVLVGDCVVLILTVPLAKAGGLPGAVVLGAFCLGIPATLAIAIHEAGHLLGGRLAGLTPLFASVGPVTFTRTELGWRLGWSRRLPLYGFARCTEPRDFWQAFTFALAGPLANFAASMIAAPLALAAAPSLVGCWLGLLAVHSAFLGICSLLPIIERAHPSDGLFLWRLLSRGLP